MSRVPFFRWPAAAGLLAVLVLGQADAASLPGGASLPVDDTLQADLAALPPVQAPGSTGRWYERFHDETLSTLALAATRRDPAADRAALEAGVARAYIVARAAALRLSLLAEDQATVLRLRELASASAPLRSTAARIGQAENQLLGSREMAASAQALWRDAVERLAAWTGLPADALQTRLAGAGAAPTRLVFDARGGSLALQPAAAGAQAGAQQSLPGLTQAAWRAEQQARSDERALREVLARARQGRASEVEQIAAYRRLLASNDQWMAAGADLALAWVQVVQDQGVEAFAVGPGPSGGPARS